MLLQCRRLRRMRLNRIPRQVLPLPRKRQPRGQDKCRHKCRHKLPHSRATSARLRVHFRLAPLYSSRYSTL